jgi:hypothetical protein
MWGEYNFIKHTLMDFKTQIHPKREVAGDFTTPLSPIGRSSIQKKINKESQELNDTIGLMDLKDIYRILHSTTEQYTFSLAAHGTFSKIDHSLNHKASLEKYKKFKSPCILYCLTIKQ